MNTKKVVITLQRKFFWAVIVMIISLGIVTTGCDKVEGEGGGVVSPTEGESYIIESVFCVNVDNESRPILITDTFVVGDIVYYWTRWGNVSETHTVRAEWFDPDGDFQTDTEQTFTAQGGQAITWFFLDTTSSAPEGEWWVDIYFDDEFMRSQIFILIP